MVQYLTNPHLGYDGLSTSMRINYVLWRALSKTFETQEKGHNDRGFFGYFNRSGKFGIGQLCVIWVIA